MKRIFAALCLWACLILFAGCARMPDQVDVNAIATQIQSVADQFDAEAIITGVIDKIDWQELKNYANEGYDSLTEKYPSLKSENIKIFLKENGLELINKYISSTDDNMQEKASKLGQILKILYPDLSDEVDAVIGK